MTVEIGVTGNIGAGKSTVARGLARRGAYVIDADALAGRALRDEAVVAEIVAVFGRDVAPGGTVDRGALAARVFADDQARRRLEAIVHPRVRAWASEEAARVKASPDAPPVIVHDVPLLFETGLDRHLDLSVLVDAPLETRIARVTERSGLTADQVRARDAAQGSLTSKRERADVVIDNDGDPAALEAQLGELWRRLTERPAHG